MIDLEQRALMAERSTWDFDWTPPGFESIDRPDVFAWSYESPWAGSRGVARATWRDEEIDERLPDVAAFFAQRPGRPYRWYVGPSTTSSALSRLVAARARGVHAPRMMTAELDAVRFSSKAVLDVREVTPGALVRQVHDAAFPEDTVERRELAVKEQDAYLSGGRRGGQLAAFVEDELVGFASWRDSADGCCVELVGGWTKPSHRRRGIYSTLSAYRCDRARERGRRYAVVVADPTSSGPVLDRAGFIDHGPLYIYHDVRL